jgi:hypothetical protein
MQIVCTYSKYSIKDKSEPQFIIDSKFNEILMKTELPKVTVVFENYELLYLTAKSESKQIFH